MCSYHTWGYFWFIWNWRWREPRQFQMNQKYHSVKHRSSQRVWRDKDPERLREVIICGWVRGDPRAPPIPIWSWPCRPATSPTHPEFTTGSNNDKWPGKSGWSAAWVRPTVRGVRQWCARGGVALSVRQQTHSLQVNAAGFQTPKPTSSAPEQDNKRRVSADRKRSHAVIDTVYILDYVWVNRQISSSPRGCFINWMLSMVCKAFWRFRLWCWSGATISTVISADWESC